MSSFFADLFGALSNFFSGAEAQDAVTTVVVAILAWFGFRG